MKTRQFLRRELKRDIRVSFKLSRRNFQELFLRVVEEWGTRLHLPLRGRKTAVFLHLLQREVAEIQNRTEQIEWEMRELSFIRLTREQKDEILALRATVEHARKAYVDLQQEHARLQETLRSMARCLEEAGFFTVDTHRNPG